MQFEIAQAAAHLTRTPRLLDVWLRGLPDAWLHTNEGGDSWSPFDVLGHLIHGERTDWMPRARIILADPAAGTFEPFDRFAQYEETGSRSVDELLDEFAALRAENVRALREMNPSPASLSRTGVHPDFGEVTLRQLLATWVVHDWNHVSQIARVFSRQLRDEVGPWLEFLPLLRADPRGTPWDTRDRGSGS